MTKSKSFLNLAVFLIALNVFSQDFEEKDFATFDEFLNEQNGKIASIENGFSQDEVKSIMGESIVVKVPKVGDMKAVKQLFKQPHYINLYKSNPKKIIDVFWYFSTPKDQNGIVSKSECTPVIFENNMVVGQGWEFFHAYRRTTPLR